MFCHLFEFVQSSFNSFAANCLEYHCLSCFVLNFSPRFWRCWNSYPVRLLPRLNFCSTANWSSRKELFAKLIFKVGAVNTMKRFINLKKTTLVSSEELKKLHSFRVENSQKLHSFRVKNSQKLHSFRVKNSQKLHSFRVENSIQTKNLKNYDSLESVDYWNQCSLGFLKKMPLCKSKL